jgi:hypothetical protein
LVALLTNSDDGNFKASHFVEGYRRRKGDLQGPMRKLDEQVFHLAKRRPGTVIGKFDTGNAKEVFDWIEENFADFLTKLGALRPLFNDKRLIRPRTRASTSPLVQPDLERRLKWRVPPLSFPSRVTRRVWR